MIRLGNYKSAQGMLEYLVLMTVLVTVTIIFVASTLRPQLSTALGNAADDMGEAVENNVVFSRF